MWREGPSWLKLPRTEWPLRSDFRKHEVPGLKKEFEILPTISNLTQLVTAATAAIAEEEAEKVNVNTISTTEADFDTIIKKESEKIDVY